MTVGKADQREGAASELTAGPEPGVLSPEQQVALLHIVAGRGALEAARVAGVNRGTVYRWLRDPAFCREVREARKAARVTARLQIIGLLPAALELVRDAMLDQEVSAAMAIVRSMKLLDRLGTVETAGEESQTSADAGATSGEQGAARDSRR
jgi:hypothetical protein